MDAITLNAIGGLDLYGILNEVFWHVLRCGAMMTAMPVIGGGTLPRHARLALALAVSAVFASYLPPAPPPVLSATSLLLALKEVAIGLTMGFSLRLAFETGRIAGEYMSQSMALSMAQMSDPINGSSSTVISVWFHIIFGLMFFAMDGHLAVVAALLQSYDLVPVTATIPNFSAMASTAPSIFHQVLVCALTLALPVMLACVTINICFGVLGKASPQLNPIQVGLPTVLLVGLYLVTISVPNMKEPITFIIQGGLEAAANAVR